jgi:hypothetical protein
MTRSKISNIYKAFSLVTLAISAFLTIFYIEESIGVRVGIGIMFNLQFHFAYLFLSRAPFEMYRHVEKQKPESKKSALKMFRLFSWAAMIMSAIMLVIILSIAVSDPKALVGVMTLIAIFLGGYSSLVKFSAD